jgi:hypothetical protein
MWRGGNAAAVGSRFAFFLPFDGNCEICFPQHIAVSLIRGGSFGKWIWKGARVQRA